MEPWAHFSADLWPKTYDNLLANCRVSHHSSYDAQDLRFMAQQNGHFESEIWPNLKF